MLNPLKVLTSGVERKGSVPFYSGGKWRFAERVAWWNAYTDATPVVVGHYWRRVNPVDRARVGKGDADLFAGTPPGRDFKLAALRWPEKTLQFDDGHRQATDGFGT
jgi:hypothetical protein